MGANGNFLVLTALFVTAAGLVLALVGAIRQSPRATAAARWLAFLFPVLLIGANVVMEVALLQPDFSVFYVSHVGSRTAPTWVRVVSLWSSLEGSILFWGAILGVYVIAGVRTLKRFPKEEPWGLAVLHLCGSFFALLIGGPANPFGPVYPVPTDGPGPNALLQNHLAMVIHPPLLYLGYVGMTVPFALAMAALMSGRLTRQYLASLRLWLLVPWIFLSAGIVMGAWWAYEVLGWGGYWGWDPVENSPLLPWITTTAALHAALVVERRGALRGWTISLVLVAFLLTILGTFMTRSGIFNSVHAFAQSDIGPTFLTFLALCLILSVLALSFRLSKLGTDASIDHVTSREGAIIIGNLVLVVIMLTVLLGTVFPLITEAVRGVQISVGEPYFNKMTVPLAVAVLFLMGIGPALPWGRAGSMDAWKRLIPAAILGVAAFFIGLAFGARDGWLLATLLCAGFAFEVAIDSLVRPVIQRVRNGRAVTSALAAELTGSRRRVGAFVAHAGLIVALVGVGVSATGKLHKEVTMKVGDTAKLGRYQLTFLGTRIVQEANRQSTVADVAVTQDGTPIGKLEPKLNYYFTQREPVGTPAVRSSMRDDLYLSAMSIEPEAGILGMRIFVNPMVIWLWIGAIFVALGGILAAWPRRARSQVAVTEEKTVGGGFLAQGHA